jgi:putative acetyltransferase
LTAALSAAPGLNAGTLDAAIFNSSPVWGFRPARAARSRTSKVPKLTTDKESPICSVLEIISTSAATARSACALFEPFWLPLLQQALFCSFRDSPVRQI